MKMNKKISFNNFPPELISNILSYLSVENLLVTSLLNKKFNAVTCSMFHKKFSVHFPSQRVSGKKINWHREFCKAYREEYSHIAIIYRSFFSLLKEGNIAHLQEKIDFSKNGNTIGQIKDNNGISLLKWANIKGHQSLLNAFYFRTGSIIHPLLWAIVCHQPVERVKNFIVDVRKDIFYQGVLLAVEYGYGKIFEMLLAQCRDFSLIEGTPNFREINFEKFIYIAVKHGYSQILDRLTGYVIFDNPCKHDKTPLYLAAKKGYSDFASWLLKRGVSPNRSRRSTGETPLFVAAKNGHNEVIKILLAAGSILDARENEGNEPLHIAIKYKHIDTIYLLIEYGANIHARGALDETPLSLAVQANLTKICRLLLSKGAQVDVKNFYGKTPLWLAKTAENYKIIDLLTANNVKSQINPFFDAVHRNDLQGVHDQLLQSVGVNDTCFTHITPLYVATEKENLAIMTELIQHGALIRLACTNGWTPLHVAVDSNNVSSVNFLLTVGADCNSPAYNGITPLHLAAKNSNKDIIKKLLVHGADANLIDEHGVVPLYIAAKKGDEEIVELLLGNGAQLISCHGGSAIDVALRHQHKKVIHVMLKKNLIDFYYLRYPQIEFVFTVAIENNLLNVVKTLLLAHAYLAHHKFLNGKTALHLAAEKGDIDIVYTLLEHKAKINSKSIDGKTPLDLAKENNHIELIEFLQKKISRLGVFHSPLVSLHRLFKGKDESSDFQTRSNQNHRQR